MVLECPDPASRGGTFVMVIDGGSAEPEEYAGGDGRLPLDAYLALRGVDHIDLMAATHIHEDHLCGLLPAAERLRPAVLWQPLPPGSHRFMRPLAVPKDAAPTQAKFIRALNDCRTLCMAMEGRLVRPEAGMERTLCPGLTVRVLGPSAGRAGELERLCREIYREADPSARQQRLDRLDAGMNNFQPDPVPGLPGHPHPAAGRHQPGRLRGDPGGGSAGRPLQGGPPRPAGRRVH